MRKAFAYPYILWISMFIIAPLVLVLYYALTATVDGQVVFTFAQFSRFFSSSLYIGVAVHSVRMGVYTTIICFIIGYPLAYILASKGFVQKSFLIFLFIVPMWMNFLIRTYAWVTILERNGVLNAILRFLRLPTIDILFTDSAVLLGMVYNFLPFMVLPIYTSLTRMDTRIIEAAQDLGANPRNIFARIVFPLSVPGIVSGITMVFMPAVATFIIPNLLGGGQYFLIGNLIEQQFLRGGNRHFGSAVTIILVLMMFISMAILSRMDKSHDEKEAGAPI